MNPSFMDGIDRTTFHPFVLADCRETDSPCVQLQFSDHAWLLSQVGSDHIGDFYLNGYGIQGMVVAARMLAGQEPIPDDMQPDSEGDCCYLYFDSLETAVKTATIAHQMIHDASQRSACARLAEDEGFDDL